MQDLVQLIQTWRDESVPTADQINALLFLGAGVINDVRDGTVAIPRDDESCESKDCLCQEITADKVKKILNVVYGVSMGLEDDGVRDFRRYMATRPS